jgi:hypothetical protein
MSKLWTFGDSFTESYNPKYEWSRKYIEWKGYTPKVYGEVISERLGYELINKGLGGSSNQTILETICNSVDDIKSDDIVIIGWSSPIRFRLVDEWGEWQHMIPHSLFNFEKMGGVGVESVLEILENRYHIKYSKEVESWIKLINKSLSDCKVIHWKYHRDGLNVNLITDKENVNKETGGLVNDGHFSENGQIEIANSLIEILNSSGKRKLL